MSDDGCAPPWRIFSQAPLDLARVKSNARAFFGLSVSVVRERGRGGAAEEARLRISDSAGRVSGEVVLFARETTPEDRADALSAAASGEASGMVELARRCDHLWTMTGAVGRDESLMLASAALLASVALGPVLPPDRSGLLGVGGARQRLELLLGVGRLER